MDRIFIVSILVTFLGSATTTDFEDALTDIDGKCIGSAPVPTPCSVQKSAVETANNLTVACTNLPAYKTCLKKDCDQDTDLDNFIATMEATCSQPGNLPKSELDDPLTKIDGKCMTKSVIVPTPCSAEKAAVETPFKAKNLTEACTNLPAYKTCLKKDCDQNTDLDNFIATMEATCSSGFMKISVSMLTLFLAAIVNFL